MSGRCKGGIAGRSWAPWIREVAFSLFTPTCLFMLAVWLEGEVVSVIATVIAHLFVGLAAVLALSETQTKRNTLSVKTVLVS